MRIRGRNYYGKQIKSKKKKKKKSGAVEWFYTKRFLFILYTVKKKKVQYQNQKNKN